MGLTGGSGYHSPYFCMYLFSIIKESYLVCFGFKCLSWVESSHPTKGLSSEDTRRAKKTQHSPGSPEACSHLWLPGQLHSSHLPLAAGLGETILQAGSPSLPRAAGVTRSSKKEAPKRGRGAPSPATTYRPHCRPGAAPCPAWRRRTSAGTAPGRPRWTPPLCSQPPRIAYRVPRRRSARAPACTAPPAASQTGAGCITAPSWRPAAGLPAVPAPANQPRRAPGGPARSEETEPLPRAIARSRVTWAPGGPACGADF